MPQSLKLKAKDSKLVVTDVNIEVRFQHIPDKKPRYITGPQPDWHIVEIVMHTKEGNHLILRRFEFSDEIENKSLKETNSINHKRAYEHFCHLKDQISR